MAVDVPVAELLVRMARELVQTGPAAARAALLWTAVGNIHKDVLVVTLARPTAWGSKAQVLAVAIIFCAQVGSCGGIECFEKPFFSSLCASEPSSHIPVWLDLLNAFKPTT